MYRNRNEAYHDLNQRKIRPACDARPRTAGSGPLHTVRRNCHPTGNLQEISGDHPESPCPGEAAQGSSRQGRRLQAHTHPTGIHRRRNPRTDRRFPRHHRLPAGRRGNL